MLEATPPVLVLVLVRDGVIIESHLNRERISPNDIFSAMHKEGIERLERVKWAILESDGAIAIIPAHASTAEVT